MPLPLPLPLLVLLGPLSEESVPGVERAWRWEPPTPARSPPPPPLVLLLLLLHVMRAFSTSTREKRRREMRASGEALWSREMSLLGALPPSPDPTNPRPTTSSNPATATAPAAPEALSKPSYACSFQPLSPSCCC